MYKERVAITIPIFKEKVEGTELLSLNQCMLILGKYPIIFFAPLSLNTTFYENLCKNNFQYKIERFEDNFFVGINGYNILMLNPNFYKRFLKFRFILIYQLDAFVFKDELLQWCKYNYDFIGAPLGYKKNLEGEMQVLKNYTAFWKYINRFIGFEHKISNVGNGGFSLRKTQKFYLMTLFLKSRIKKWGNLNEDGFFMYWGNIFFPLFSLPSEETALRFSIELFPSESFMKLNNILPFGCHAFEKYDFEFWKPYLQLNKNSLL